MFPSSAVSSSSNAPVNLGIEDLPEDMLVHIPSYLSLNNLRALACVSKNFNERVVRVVTARNSSAIDRFINGIIQKLSADQPVDPARALTLFDLFFGGESNAEITGNSASSQSSISSSLAGSSQPEISEAESPYADQIKSLTELMENLTFSSELGSLATVEKYIFAVKTAIADILNTLPPEDFEKLRLEFANVKIPDFNMDIFELARIYREMDRVVSRFYRRGGVGPGGEDDFCAVCRDFIALGYVERALEFAFMEVEQSGVISDGKYGLFCEGFLGSLWRHLNDLDKFIEVVGKLPIHDPLAKDYVLYFISVTLATELRDPKRALEFAGKILTRSLQTPLFRAISESFLEHSSDVKAAMEVLKMIPDNGQRIRCIDKLARIFINQGQLGHAAQLIIENAEQGDNDDLQERRHFFGSIARLLIGNPGFKEFIERDGVGKMIECIKNFFNPQLQYEIFHKIVRVGPVTADRVIKISSLISDENCRSNVIEEFFNNHYHNGSDLLDTNDVIRISQSIPNQTVRIRAFQRILGVLGRIHANPEKIKEVKDLLAAELK